MLKEGLYDDDEIQLMQEGSIKKFGFEKLRKIQILYKIIGVLIMKSR